jgi:pyruvate,water dikinase
MGPEPKAVVCFNEVTKDDIATVGGQAPSVYPDLTEKLMEWGITSVSVSPDMIGITREIITKAEARLKT